MGIFRNRRRIAGPFGWVVITFSAAWGVNHVTAGDDVPQLKLVHDRTQGEDGTIFFEPLSYPNELLGNCTRERILEILGDVNSPLWRQTLPDLRLKNNDLEGRQPFRDQHVRSFDPDVRPGQSQWRQQGKSVDQMWAQSAGVAFVRDMKLEFNKLTCEIDLVATVDGLANGSDPRLNQLVGERAVIRSGVRLTGKDGVPNARTELGRAAILHAQQANAAVGWPPLLESNHGPLGTGRDMKGYSGPSANQLPAGAVVGIAGQAGNGDLLATDVNLVWGPSADAPWLGDDRYTVDLDSAAYGANAQDGTPIKYNSEFPDDPELANVSVPRFQQMLTDLYIQRGATGVWETNTRSSNIALGTDFTIEHDGDETVTTFKMIEPVALRSGDRTLAEMRPGAVTSVTYRTNANGELDVSIAPYDFGAEAAQIAVRGRGADDGLLL